MDSKLWDGNANGSQPVLELPNGDVWVGAAEEAGGRRFRRHLGHVVEVFDNGRIRRVGPGLRPARPWLLADGPLTVVIERALLEAADVGATWAAPASGAEAPPVDAGAPAAGLLRRLAALLGRGEAWRSEPAPPPPPWSDTMPWTHPR
jgi:hypothetical protein